MGHVSATGTLDWTYFDDTRIIAGYGLEDFLWDDEGNVYVLTTEDPVSYNYPDEEVAELCLVYGCDNLAVRKLSSEGELLWSYEHRATSRGAALVLDADGTLVVSAVLESEESSGLLLRFSVDAN